MKRRDFVRLATMAGAATLLPWPRAYAQFAQSLGLRKFVAPLRGLDILGDPHGIPVSVPDTSLFPGVDFHTIAMEQFEDELHPDLAPTRLWGYTVPGKPKRHLGGLIVARKGTPVRLRVFNALPPKHILPVDDTVPGAEASAAQNRASLHLHGGHVPWPSDGGPFQWFGPGDTGTTRPALTGASFLQWLPDGDANPTADHWYPNEETARLMWYHDHAFGITRLNAYAGLATGYVVRDEAEIALEIEKKIPGLAHNIPLVIQDKVFAHEGDALHGLEPTTNEWAEHAGALWYPSEYDRDFFAVNPGGFELPDVSLVPEFWGDTMLVNGTAYPYAEVQPRSYRLRLLNACNTRFLRLRVAVAKGKTFPDNTEADLKTILPMQQIGTEGGFLPAPATVGTAAAPLVLAPAERADLIVDFSDIKPGQFLILYNDAPVPFPCGMPMADFHADNPKLMSPPARGFSPDTRTLMQFRVTPAPAVKLEPLAPGDLASAGPDLLVQPGVMTPPPGAVERHLTLNEAFDDYGRLSQLLGTNASTGPRAFGLPSCSRPTETPKAGDIEVWYVYNLSADTHPIHFHLANCQILYRQRFNARQFNGVATFLGRPIPPDPNEQGWKDTVRMNPGEVTVVVMKFELPPNPVVNGTPVEVPFSNRLEVEYGIKGYEYVWHCHILEHEEHDMMRPLVIV